ncbi:cytochrome P450 2G1-like isoform X2 [Dendropsophus ebraccatus]|uniref:cytochrome P450 2G1-like isoform X2 n=1 Tax=Dendropsophus ebraccatus TaxID=150705 RepID=UPI003831A31F
MDIAWTGILILTCIFIYSTWDTFYRRRNLPPGPTPLPFIGTLLHITSGELVNSLLKLWDKYGSVYTLYFGSRPVVVLCGYDAVKEALIDRGEEFGARGSVPVLEKFTQGYGISLSNGERWKLTRTFTVKTLKSFGFGKKSIEWKIQTEAQCIVDEFRKSNSQPFDPHKNLMDAFSNVLCSVIFGDRFEYKDERFIKFLGIAEESFHIASSSWGQLHSILPTIMNHVPGPHQRMISISEELAEFIHERVKASQENLDPSSPRHFIDSFLIKMEEEKNNPNTDFNLRNLLVTTHNLFVAGIETVSTTLRHGLLILLRYPEVQAKIHKEIDQEIGRERTPNFEDRMRMHYTQAVISEIQRFGDVLPLNLPHMATRDVQFRGYHIPKGTDIYPLLCTVHRDPKRFSSPWKFNPNHFLDVNGKFMKNDALMAFSAGKRICPGESLARMEIFIFLTTILQNFKLTSPTEFTDSDVAPKLAGFLNAPIDYELSFVPR